MTFSVLYELQDGGHEVRNLEATLRSVGGERSNGKVRGDIELCPENERWIITEETEEVRSRLAAAALFVSTAHCSGKAHVSAQ